MRGRAAGFSATTTPASASPPSGIVGGAAWYPAHMAREFGWSGTEIGLGLGFAMIAGGVIGKMSPAACMVKKLFELGYTRRAHCAGMPGALLGATPLGVVAMTSGQPLGVPGGLHRCTRSC